MKLAIDVYNRAEQEALLRVGYAQYSAFSTKTFDDHGFPTTITDLRQLVRYVDFFVNYDLNRLPPDQFYRTTPLETNFTFDEIILLKKVSDGVLSLMEETIGKRIGVHFSHLGAVALFRVVQAVADMMDRDSLKVFEVGPGCGYTGVVLGLTGHRYASYDITQGYYLWQSRLLNKFFPDEFDEIAGNEDADLSNLRRIAHLPWWSYMDLFKSAPISADIIIANSNLGEMHAHCLKYMLRVSRQMFEGSDVGLIIFGNYGAPHLNQIESIDQEFQNAGFEKVLSNNVYGFAPVGHKIPSSIIDSLENRIPLFDGSGTGKTAGARDFVDYADDIYPEEFRFWSFLADWPETI